MSVRVLTGDCREVLRTLPDASVHCCVTSPPYWGLRDYGVAGQIGLEATPADYVAQMVAVFREVRRVLRDDATVWLNLGDSYAGGGGGNYTKGTRNTSGQNQTNVRNRPDWLDAAGAKPKDLLGIPWLVAFALQADGWYLRSDIIWHKPNPMPESVTDRPTSAHEHVFLLAKSARYFFDAEAVKEEGTIPAGTLGAKGSEERFATPGVNSRPPEYKVYSGTRNIRNVWTIATQPFSEAHFATFPPALIEPCIKAGTSERGCCAACGAPWVRQTQIERVKHSHPPGPGGRQSVPGADLGPKSMFNSGLVPVVTTTGWSPSCQCNAATVPATVLDPFGGAGTTALVADRLGRNAILVELNPEYAAMARRRVTDDAGMFASVA